MPRPAPAPEKVPEPVPEEQPEQLEEVEAEQVQGLEHAIACAQDLLHRVPWEWLQPKIIELSPAGNGSKTKKFGPF